MGSSFGVRSCVFDLLFLDRCYDSALGYDKEDRMGMALSVQGHEKDPLVQTGVL